MESFLEIIYKGEVIRAISIICSVILFILAFVHVYWSWGGRRGLKATIPEINGKMLYAVSPLGAFGMFFMFLLCGLLILGRVGFFGSPEPKFLYTTAPWFLTLIFMLRAVGDIRFMGLFKRVRFTYFAWWDNFVIIPLCSILIAMNVIIGFSPEF